MARHIYQGTFKDGNGRVVTSGAISVYEAGTITAANIYTASAGGSAVNSVTSDSTDGSFLFWVDEADYSPVQLFKIVLSKTNFTSKTYDDIQVYPNHRLQVYAKGDLPTASTHTACMVYVSDEAGGATIAFSNGTNWVRVQDLATVS
jgi:hypothetical protein